jgi:hypothetical protein
VEGVDRAPDEDVRPLPLRRVADERLALRVDLELHRLRVAPDDLGGAGDARRERGDDEGGDERE